MAITGSKAGNILRAGLFLTLTVYLTASIPDIAAFYPSREYADVQAQCLWLGREDRFGACRLSQTYLGAALLKHFILAAAMAGPLAAAWAFLGQGSGWGRRMAISYGMAVPIACLGVVATMAASDGLEPQGLCHFVSGDDGLLPINPNRGGSETYSCNPDWRIFSLWAALYVPVVGTLIAAGWFSVSTVVDGWRAILEKKRSQDSLGRIRPSSSAMITAACALLFLAAIAMDISRTLAPPGQRLSCVNASFQGFAEHCSFRLLHLDIAMLDAVPLAAGFGILAFGSLWLWRRKRR